jgi:hypothetical protein
VRAEDFALLLANDDEKNFDKMIPHGSGAIALRHYWKE